MCGLLCNLDRPFSKILQLGARGISLLLDSCEASKKGFVFCDQAIKRISTTDQGHARVDAGYIRGLRP